MIIEKGDFFMVERGAVREELVPVVGRLSMLGLPPGDTRCTPPIEDANIEQVLNYDDSYLPFIFLAKETASPLVAAVCVAVANGQSRATGNIGKQFLFNQTNVELMSVSEGFMQVCQTAKV